MLLANGYILRFEPNSNKTGYALSWDRCNPMRPYEVPASFQTIERDEAHTLCRMRLQVW
jgi:hypothetical protein